MKSFAMFALALLSTTSFAAPKRATPGNRFAGSYSRATMVVDWDSTTQAKCKAAKGTWDQGECFSPSEDNVDVSLVEGSTDFYVVTMSVVSTRLNLCDVEETFTRVGNKLQFTAGDKSSIEITRVGNKLVVKDNNYSIGNCGHNAYVGGNYDRKGPSKALSIEQMEIKECGFAGCLN